LYIHFNHGNVPCGSGIRKSVREVIYFCVVVNNLFFSWQPESKFPFSQVRLPPEGVPGKSDFSENQEIEVYSRANEQEACGWWKAIIKVRYFNTYKERCKVKCTFLFC
jgi:hypothetical protein